HHRDVLRRPRQPRFGARRPRPDAHRGLHLPPRRPHTADDPTKYRDKAEEEIWEDRDPVTRLKAYLDKHTDTSDDFIAEVDAEADTLAARIRHNCMSMEDPDGVEMFAHVTSEPHSLVDEERAGFLAYQASFADAGEA